MVGRHRTGRGCLRNSVTSLTKFIGDSHQPTTSTAAEHVRRLTTELAMAALLDVLRELAALWPDGEPVFPPDTARRSSSTMITLFTLPKPFVGHIGMIQRNAIQSWTGLHPDVDILIFGNEQGTADITRTVRNRHFPEVDVNEYGTPRMSGHFDRRKTREAFHARAT